MKQMNLLRVGVLLVAALFVVGAFTTGGFAKYITGSTGHDDARVAMFGVEISVGGNSFSTNYLPNPIDRLEGKYAVESHVDTDTNTQDNVVAPGTSSTEVLGEDDKPMITEFGLKGIPEVAVHMDLGFKPESLSDVYLPAGTYVDPTGQIEDGYFKLEKPYYPVKFTLIQTYGWDETTKEFTTMSKKLVDNGTLKDYGEGNSVEAVMGEITGNYTPGTVLNNTYVLSWSWAFDEEGNTELDAADTVLGNLAANKTAKVVYVEGSEPIALDAADFSTDIAYDLSITITQID